MRSPQVPHTFGAVLPLVARGVELLILLREELLPPLPLADGPLSGSRSRLALMSNACV